MSYPQFSEPLLKKAGAQIMSLDQKVKVVENVSQTWEVDKKQLGEVSLWFDQRIQRMQSLRQPLYKYTELQRKLRNYGIQAATLRAHPLVLRVRQHGLLLTILAWVLGFFLRVRQTIWHIWDFIVNTILSLWEGLRGVPAITWFLFVVVLMVIALIILIITNFDALLRLFQL